jgi:hypothetical protein
MGWALAALNKQDKSSVAQHCSTACKQAFGSCSSRDDAETSLITVTMDVLFFPLAIL